MDVDKWREEQRRARDSGIPYRALVRYALMPWSGTMRIPTWVMPCIAEDLGIALRQASLVAYALGYRAEERSTKVREVMEAAEERFPGKVAPRGSMLAMAEEFGVERRTVDTAFRRLGITIPRVTRPEIQRAIRKRWPSGTIPFGGMKELADELGIQRQFVSNAAQAMGWVSARPRRRT